MNIERINDYIDCWAKAVKVPDEYVVVVKELLPKLINKYSNLYESIYVSQDNYDKYVIKPKDDKYSMEDFFLNRLLRNVWHFGDDSHYKGDYTPDELCISFNTEKIKLQLAKVMNKDREDFKELDEIARKKVIMHEFEHALQTRFNLSALDMRYRETYQKIINNIKEKKNGKYIDEINSYEELRDKNYFGTRETYISTGLHYSSSEKYKKTYRYMEGFDNLNEIFNETESLEMAGARRQTYRIYENMYYFEIRNLESSNYIITNYGELLKILIGEHNTFKSMYLDPSFAFETFNRAYQDVFEKYFHNDKDAVGNIIEQLNIIKKEDKLENHLLLQKVLAECLLKKIKGNLTIAPLDYMMEEIKKFKTHSLWGVNQPSRETLDNYHILVEARDIVKERSEIVNKQGI